MKSLETVYMGLTLRNPIVVSSSGLTKSTEKIKQLEDKGAGAVVLKSLFEEQINYEVGDLVQYNNYPEAEDYIKSYSRSHSVEQYLTLIADAKKAVDIPVIASINCITPTDWTEFARKMEKAGADAIELNINIIPTGKLKKSIEYEEKYFEIINAVSEKVSIPVAVKIGYHFTNLMQFTEMAAASGADGIVLFNRFYEPDIDINKLSFTAADIFSIPNDIRHSLRWVGMLSGRINLTDISASTGIHDGKAVIKHLLAGAKTTQICSVLYQSGFDVIEQMLEELTTWMDDKGFDSIDDFRGKMNYSKIKSPAVYERTQFMKYFSSID